MSFRARLLVAALSCAALFTGFVPHGLTRVSAEQQAAAPAGPVFEVRTYVASAGKFDDLLARFRDHTIRIFARHGMKSVAYWIPTDQRNTLVYIIQHESRDAAAANWKAFSSDPEWMKVAAASNANGNIVARTESYFATAADFSPIK